MSFLLLNVIYSVLCGHEDSPPPILLIDWSIKRGASFHFINIVSPETQFQNFDKMHFFLSLSFIRSGLVSSLRKPAQLQVRNTLKCLTLAVVLGL